MTILQKEAELQEIVQLIGPDALPEAERTILEIARMLREDFLQQIAFDEIDSFCSLEKQFGMLRVIITFYDHALESIRRGVVLTQILELPIKNEIARMKEIPNDKAKQSLSELTTRISKEIAIIEVL